MECLGVMFSGALCMSVLLVTTSVSHKLSGDETVFQYEVTVGLMRKRQDIPSVNKISCFLWPSLHCASRLCFAVCFAFIME